MMLDEQTEHATDTVQAPAAAVSRNDIVASGEAGSESAASPPSSMLALIARAARDTTVDVDKLERMLAMHERLQAAAAYREYNEAMNRAQEEIQPVARTAENTQTRSWYAKLEAVDKAIRTIYLRHGFALSRNTVPPLTPGNIRVEISCAHSGHVEKFHREAAPDTMGPKGAPVKTMLHGSGSTETYLTRYAICGIFNVVFKDQDNDGNNQFLDEVQIATIVELMAKAKVGPKFLHYMKALSVEEAGSIEAAVGTISGRSYQKALSTLNEQIQKQ